jgi:hypothetical protein
MKQGLKNFADLSHIKLPHIRDCSSDGGTIGITGNFWHHHLFLTRTRPDTHATANPGKQEAEYKRQCHPADERYHGHTS